MTHNKHIIRLFTTLFAALLCLTCFSTTAFVGGGDEDCYYEEEPTTEPITEPETRPLAPLTPDGQATALDNVTDEDGKEFFTFITPDENVFYLVIDRQRDSENVYFLNAVTEEDLMALAEKEEPTESAIPEPVCGCEDRCQLGAVNAACEVCKLNLKDCVGEEAKIPEPVEEEKDSDLGLLLFLALFVLAGGAAGYYFKVYRPKQDFIDDDDAEEYESEAEAEEETINEDEDGEGSEVQEDGTDPQEVDYYDDYPDEMEEEDTEEEMK